MKLAFSALALVVCSACVGPKEAGPYPRGFITGDHMHYLSPKVARALYGAPKDPISKEWVATDEDGNVYVSPELQAKLRK